ncbi:MAG: lasso RiPP family leader peptide-containing protein [Gemmatimonadetes bacterium]|nr:lasso RiPP family leader peptide-containing protein [Gemmatimonadota bacterium]
MQNRYERPVLQAFGSLRELTMVGWTGANDGCSIVGPGVVGNGNNYQQVCGNSRS